MGRTMQEPLGTPKDNVCVCGWGGAGGGGGGGGVWVGGSKGDYRPSGSPSLSSSSPLYLPNFKL